MENEYNKYIVEFLGTLVILYVLFYTRDSVNAPIYIGLSIAATIILGDQFEQGHFNPLYSMLRYFDGKNSSNELLLYLAAQLLAGFVCYVFILGGIYAKRVLFINFL